MPSEHKPSARRRFWLQLAVGVLLAYLAAAYVLLPFAWERYARRHPSFVDDPRVTMTSDGHPGDPLNVALIGTDEEIHSALETAGWHSAAPLGVKSDLKIAVDVVLSRPDDQAPVSNLFLFGRKEDLAFEQPVGNSPRQRHHVRFWKTARTSNDGRAIWIGSASYDERAGLSHTTGQITHHIAPDVDRERNHLFDDLRRTGGVLSVSIIDDFHTVRDGRNGGGDPWHTDGALYVGTLASHASAGN